MSKPVIECKQVTKIFREGDLAVEVLRGIDLTIVEGEQVAIVGSSGSGKSTLLHLLGGLSEPTSGTVLVDGKNINRQSHLERGRLRNAALGFVYQFHHLLPEFSALENVAMPLLIRQLPPKEALEQARQVLKRIGLVDRLKHKPGELSGGERQRAAIARAVVTRPKCILADEPTGNLDHKTADTIHSLLLELNREYNTSLVVVTHDLQLASRMQRVLAIEDGLFETGQDVSGSPG